MHHNTVVCLVLLLLCMEGLAVGDDWPTWRGPDGDGVWHETDLVAEIGPGPLPVRWRAPIANGYSGPTVADGRVYVTDRLTSPEPVERVHCFNAADGTTIWSYAYPCVYAGIAHRNGPRAAVTLSEGRAYSLGTMGHFHCFDARTGQVLWGKDLKQEYRARVPEWGIAPAAVVEGRLVIVLIGGEGACLVAFDKASGVEVWRALDDRGSYSTPIVIDQAGQRVLVAWTGHRIVGLDPATGRLLWSHPFEPAQMVHNIASPVFHEGYLFLSGFFDGSLLLKIHPNAFSVEELWRRRGRNATRTEALHCCISTPLLAGEHIYGIDSHGQLRCLDRATGVRRWENLEVVPQARWSTAHLVRNGEKVWMFTERGELIVARLSPDGYQEMGRAKLIEPTEGQLEQRGGVCWAPPAFAGRHIYVRNDRELVCADLSARR